MVRLGICVAVAHDSDRSSPVGSGVGHARRIRPSLCAPVGAAHRSSCRDPSSPKTLTEVLRDWAHPRSAEPLIWAKRKEDSQARQSYGLAIFHLSLFPFSLVASSSCLSMGHFEPSYPGRNSEPGKQWLVVGVVVTSTRASFIHGYKAKTPPKRGSRRSN